MDVFAVFRWRRFNDYFEGTFQLRKTDIKKYSHKIFDLNTFLFLDQFLVFLLIKILICTEKLIRNVIQVEI